MKIMVSIGKDNPRNGMRYRPDIDGLRAVAILLVLGFHAFPYRVPGGFVGVDIFFVVSGFLISGIIFRDLEGGRFEFRQFYARRLRRIVPALMVVLVFTYLFGWWVLLSDEFAQLSRHVASAAGFFSNFTLWSEAGYFDEAADTKPLQHLWSLAIEEQFYALWPLTLFIVWRRKWNIAWAIAVIGVVSFAANIVTASQNSVADFYSPACRIWELMIGALLGYWAHRQQPLPAWLSDLLAIAGLALICAAVVFINSGSRFPGWLALLPTIGTLCLILAGSSWFNRVILASRPFVGIGLISYPLYLWHWPLLVFAHILFGRLSGVQKMAILAISFVLALLTYIAVETPIRRYFSYKVAAALAVSLVVTLGVSTTAIFNEWLPRQRDEGVSRLLAAAGDWDFPDGPDRRIAAGRLTRVTSYKSKLSSTTLFIGDSNMEQYFPRIARVIDEKPNDTNSAIMVGNQERNCLPASRLFIEDESFCHSAIKDIEGLALAKTNVAVVLAYSGGNLQAMIESASGKANLARFIKLLTERGKRVYLLLGIPEGWELSPRLMYTGSRLSKLTMKPVDQIAFDRATYFGKYGGLRDVLKRFAAENGAIAIDPFDVLCWDGNCPVLDHLGNPLYKDGFHLRASYARSSVSYIDVTLRPEAN